MSDEILMRKIRDATANLVELKYASVGMGYDVVLAIDRAIQAAVAARFAIIRHLDSREEKKT